MKTNPSDALRAFMQDNQGLSEDDLRKAWIGYAKSKPLPKEVLREVFEELIGRLVEEKKNAQNRYKRIVIR